MPDTGSKLTANRCFLVPITLVVHGQLTTDLRQVEMWIPPRDFVPLGGAVLG